MDQSEVDAIQRPAFAYDQLERPENSIRLLEVLPVFEHGLVHVELREYTEKEKVQYRCLSYVWGSPTGKKHEIVLNDCKFIVHNNLYLFLQKASLRIPRTLLWIDAISINQDDATEKGKQVTRMADIYSGAIETLVWLGDKPDLNTALFLINHSHETPAVRDILHPLVQLHSDPYWSRAWIVQEIVRSKRSIVHTIEEHAPWERIVVVMRSCGFAEHTLHAIMPLNPVSYFDMWQDYHDIQPDGDKQGLRWIWDVMYPLYDAQCTDHRDRIYGVISLVEGGKDFEVKYMEPAIKLFWRAGSYFGAWAQPALIEILRRALRLEKSDLASSLESHMEDDLTVPLNGTVIRAQTSALDAVVRCDDTACNRYKALGQIPCSHHDILLCTRTLNSSRYCSSFACVHILLCPVVNSTNGAFEITLLAGARFTHRGVFRKRLASTALQQYAAEGWQEMSDWREFEDSIKGRALEGQWRLQIPAALAIELGKCDTTLYSQVDLPS